MMTPEWKVWDLRTYKEVHAYFAAVPAVHVDISQRRGFFARLFRLNSRERNTCFLLVAVLDGRPPSRFKLFF